MYTKCTYSLFFQGLSTVIQMLFNHYNYMVSLTMCMYAKTGILNDKPGPFSAFWLIFCPLSGFLELL